MIAWMQEHVELLSAMASMGMLVIWVLYLHLFYRSYVRARRPNLLIHQAGGYGLESRCVIANMSEGAVHVSAVLVDVHQGVRAITFQPGPLGLADADDPLRQTRQGPIASASYVDVGSFGALLRAARRHRDHRGGAPDTGIDVRVVAFVGSELFPAGARRRFDVRDRAPGLDIRPTTALPREISPRRQRALARTWLEEARSLDTDPIATATHEASDGVSRP